MNFSHSSTGISEADDEGALEEVPVFRLKTNLKSYFNSLTRAEEKSTIKCDAYPITSSVSTGET